MALRVVQNGLITLKDCRVPELDRLQNANSFRDTAKVLRMTRAGVAWFAVGCGRGAYEHALRYATYSTKASAPFSNGCAISWIEKSHRSSRTIGCDQFPFDLVPKIAALGIGGVGFKGYGSADINIIWAREERLWPSQRLCRR